MEILKTILIFAVIFTAAASARMQRYNFTSRDFCAMKVIVRCFSMSKMGLPRRTCGAQSVFELAREGVGNRENCMQATKITKWLQTKQIDVGALKREVTTNCGAFRQIHACVSPYEEHCEEIFGAFGLNMFLEQWEYICNRSMYPRLEKHILCRREMSENADDECRHFAPVLGIDFENATVSANMTEAECKKYKLILGCRSRVMLAHCSKENGVDAARFVVDFFNIQAKSTKSQCLIAEDLDPVKLAAVYEKYVANLSGMSQESKTTTSTSTTSTPATTSLAMQAEGLVTEIVVMQPSDHYDNELDDQIFELNEPFYYDSYYDYSRNTAPSNVKQILCFTVWALQLWLFIFCIWL